MSKILSFLLFATSFMVPSVLNAQSDGAQISETLSPDSQIEVFATVEVHKGTGTKSTLGWLVNPDSPKPSRTLVIILNDAGNSVRVLPFDLKVSPQESSSEVQLKIEKASLVVEDLDPANLLTQKVRYEVEFSINDISGPARQNPTSIKLIQATENSSFQPRLEWNLYNHQMQKNNVVSLKSLVPQEQDAPEEFKAMASIGSELEAHVTFDKQKRASELVILNRKNQSKTVIKKIAQSAQGVFSLANTRFGGVDMIVKSTFSQAKGFFIQNIQLQRNSGPAHELPQNLLHSQKIAEQKLNPETPIQILLETTDKTQTRYRFFTYQQTLPQKKPYLAFGLIIQNSHTNLVVPLEKLTNGTYGGWLNYFDPSRGRMITQHLNLGAGINTQKPSNVETSLTIRDTKTGDSQSRTLVFEKPSRKKINRLASFEAASWINKSLFFCSRFGASPRWKLCIPKNVLENSSKQNSSLVFWDSQSGSIQVVDAAMNHDSSKKRLLVGLNQGVWYSPIFNEFFSGASPTYELELKLPTDFYRDTSVMTLSWTPRGAALHQAVPKENVHLINFRVPMPSNAPGPTSFSSLMRGPMKLCQNLIAKFGT